ncbi:hypothetical protein [Stutzerimonas kunmingensis]|uniref:hypothetical protein n=1 Tax=Stutzerimonas kunmingensis TaxID=1211807 RepID=UPI000C9A5BC5|nr:hypothetical protein [Stutzerimonas kunmingensis]PNG02776.1 hypothetical protein CXK98_02115 [Stutzerimonas kunmingensis]PNG02784.1 hypothetical protein CXK98_02155 [Stutzerimonas kunmingensis]
MKYMTQVRKFGSRAALGVTALTASAMSFAAPVTIDTAEPIGQIAEGSTAAVAIGLAMMAFVILVGVLIKTRRAGS